MAKASEHPSLSLIKGLLLGDSGSGKTGSLVSLLQAGYKLRVYDFDNLLQVLINHAIEECPDKLDNLSYQTFTDKIKIPSIPVGMIEKSQRAMPFTDGTPTAYVNALKQLDYWRDGEEDLGRPGDWGPECIVVIDSLTFMAQAAYRYAQAMDPMGKDGRVHYKTAQDLVMNCLALLASKQFNTNVLLLAHIDYDKDHLGMTKGFPRSIGSAINSVIAGNFNCVLRVENNDGVNRYIKTNVSAIVDLKNPVPFRVKESYPIETGMADFFSAVLQPAEEVWKKAM
jgi:hypothetical protein